VARSGHKVLKRHVEEAGRNMESCARDLKKEMMMQWKDDSTDR
jgi:hypothetical protein